MKASRRTSSLTTRLTDHWLKYSEHRSCGLFTWTRSLVGQTRKDWRQAMLSSSLRRVCSRCTVSQYEKGISTMQQNQSIELQRGHRTIALSSREREREREREEQRKERHLYFLIANGERLEQRTRNKLNMLTIYLPWRLRTRQASHRSSWNNVVSDRSEKGDTLLNVTPQQRLTCSLTRENKKQREAWVPRVYVNSFFFGSNRWATRSREDERLNGKTPFWTFTQTQSVIIQKRKN